MWIHGDEDCKDRRGNIALVIRYVMIRQLVDQIESRYLKQSLYYTVVEMAK